MLTGSITGDFGKLTAFGNRVEALGSPAAMREISKAIADEGLHLVQQGFSEQRNPYGFPWQSKKYDDGRRILRGASGKLERSFIRLYAGPDAAIIGSRVREAVFAQSGTGIYGPRHARITPKKGKFLRFTSGGRFVFARSVEGSPQRLMMPMPHRTSPLWMRAFKGRASNVMRARLNGRAAAIV